MRSRRARPQIIDERSKDTLNVNAGVQQNVRSSEATIAVRHAAGILAVDDSPS